MLDKILESELQAIRAKGLYRQMRKVVSSAGPVVFCDGKQMLNFASNNYLSIADDQRLVVAAHRVMDTHGIGASASRLVVGNTDIHEELEQRLASFKNKPAALVFPTGYMANAGCIPAVASGDNDLILADRLVHASLLDACRNSYGKLRVFPHNDTDALEHLLARYHDKKRRILIVTEGVFSMDGDCAPLDRIALLARSYDALLMLDDAHGTGVLGDNGRGAAEMFSVENMVDIHMGTLSKAIGVMGGFVAGSYLLREYLVNKARSFIYTTGLPPALCAASMESLSIIQSEPERRNRLRATSGLVRNELQRIGFTVPDGITPIIPVIIGDATKVMQVSHALSEYGMIAPGIRYPTVPEGKERLRISIQSGHTDAHIDKLLSCMKKIFETL